MNDSGTFTAAAFAAELTQNRYDPGLRWASILQGCASSNGGTIASPKQRQREEVTWDGVCLGRQCVSERVLSMRRIRG